MSPAQRVLDYRREIDENQKQVREMVMESYRDIADQMDYIAFELKSPETAVNMVKGFRKTINSLSLFPQSHELDEDEELAGYGIRKTYYKN